MKKISIAMIGIGGYGSESLKALLESEREDFEIVASVDPFPEYAPLFPALQQRGIPHFSALEEMYSVGIFPQLYNSTKSRFSAAALTEPVFCVKSL